MHLRKVHRSVLCFASSFCPRHQATASFLFAQTPRAPWIFCPRWKAVALGSACPISLMQLPSIGVKARDCQQRAAVGIWTAQTAGPWITSHKSEQMASSKKTVRYSYLLCDGLINRRQLAHSLYKYAVNQVAESSSKVGAC